MHQEGIVHRDLKLENVVYESKRPDSDIFIIDYGLSKVQSYFCYHLPKVYTWVAFFRRNGSFLSFLYCFAFNPGGAVEYLLRFILQMLRSSPSGGGNSRSHDNLDEGVNPPPPFPSTCTKDDCLFHHDAFESLIA